MGHVRTVANGDVAFCATHIVMMASHGCFAHFAGNGGPHRSVGSDRIPQHQLSHAPETKAMPHEQALGEFMR